MIKTENFDKVEISSQEELRSWLYKKYTRDENVWLVTYKKDDLERYV